PHARGRRVLGDGRRRAPLPVRRDARARVRERPPVRDPRVQGWPLCRMSPPAPRVLEVAPRMIDAGTYRPERETIEIRESALSGYDELRAIEDLVEQEHRRGTIRVSVPVDGPHFDLIGAVRILPRIPSITTLPAPTPYSPPAETLGTRLDTYA